MSDIQEYRDYEIDNKPNEWGYYEGISLLDCDAYVLRDKTFEGLKTQIDETTVTAVEPPEPEIDDSLTECYECGRIIHMDANCDCVEWEATR